MLILAASLAIFVYGMTAAMLGTILPDLSARFHLTPKQNGTIAFCQAMGLILASICVGPLIDYEGKKIGLVLGLTLSGLAVALLPRSNGFRAIASHLFLLGTGGGIIVTAANALGSDVDPAHRGTALNFINIFFGLGGFATPFVSANLLGKSSTRLCHLIAGLAVIAVVVNLLTPIPPPTSAQSFVFSDMGSVIGRPVLWLCSLLLFLYVACEVGVWNWLVQHLIAQGVPQVRALNVRFCAGTTIRTFGCVSDPDFGFGSFGDAGRVRLDGDHDVRNVANSKSNHRLDTYLPGRYVHGARFSHHRRAHRRLVSPHDGNCNRDRHHVELDWTRGQLAHYWVDRRGRSNTIKEGASRAARHVGVDDRRESGTPRGYFPLIRRS
jgi:hypothetical protein